MSKFAVAVLTAGHWPERKVAEAAFVLPRALLRAQQRFEAFYAHQHANRKLRWVHALATCVLLARFKTKSKAHGPYVHPSLQLSPCLFCAPARP